MFRPIIPLVFLLTIAGCATTSNSPIGGERSTQDRFGDALISPLSDLNIVQTAIPPVIQAALKDPYEIPADTSCPALIEQVQKLNAVLGLDLDITAYRPEKTLQEKGGEFIQNEAIGSVERTIHGFIPFRGWIRKLTGAESHRRQIESAIGAGIVRRAFLKGIGQAHGCEAPAAPVKHPTINEQPVTVPASGPAVPDAAPKPAEPILEAAPKATSASVASQEEVL